MGLQLSLVLSQRTWPGVGDLDDCWVLSILQNVLACAPWLHLPGSNVVRHAAGDPDDGHKDGGSIAEILLAVRTLWPDVADGTTALRGVSFESLKAHVRAGRPVSVALMTGDLPNRLRYGAGNVAHQCTIAQRPDGSRAFANPLAAMGSKWDDVDWEEIRPAILAYGNGRVFGVAFPSAEAMIPRAPGFAQAVAEAVSKLPKPDCAADRATAFAAAKAKALAAVGGITP